MKITLIATLLALFQHSPGPTDDWQKWCPRTWDQHLDLYRGQCEHNRDKPTDNSGSGNEGGGGGDEGGGGNDGGDGGGDGDGGSGDHGHHGHGHNNHGNGNGNEGDCSGSGCTDPDNPGHGHKK